MMGLTLAPVSFDPTRMVELLGFDLREFEARLVEADDVRESVSVDRNFEIIINGRGFGN
jgi:hypothetical protein